MLDLCFYARLCAFGPCVCALLLLLCGCGGRPAKARRAATCTTDIMHRPAKAKRAATCTTARRLCILPHFCGLFTSTVQTRVGASDPAQATTRPTTRPAKRSVICSATRPATRPTISPPIKKCAIEYYQPTHTNQSPCHCILPSNRSDPLPPLAKRSDPLSRLPWAGGAYHGRPRLPLHL